MKVLQEWECCILEVHNKTIEVMIVDVTSNGNLPDEYATISKSKFSNDQLRYLKPGYIFNWSIVNYPGEDVKSIFEFKKLRVFTKEDIEKTEDKVNNIIKVLIPEPLGDEFTKVLHDNLWELYV